MTLLFLYFTSVSCPLPSARIQMAQDKWLVCFCILRQSCVLFLPQNSNWQKINDLFVCLFVFVLYVALKKRISSKIRILSCFVWLKRVLLNLLCFGICDCHQLDTPSRTLSSDFSNQTFHCWYSGLLCRRPLNMEWPPAPSSKETLSGLLQIQPQNVSLLQDNRSAMFSPLALLSPSVVNPCL